MYKLQRALVTLVSLLIVSNLVVGHHYKVEAIEYQKQIKQQNELIQTQNKIIKHNLIRSSNKELILQERSSEIYSLQQQLEKANTRNESPMCLLDGTEQTYEVSFYTAGYESTQKQKGDKGYRLTASGTYVQEGRTVAAPPSIPFGTKLYIEGIGVRVVEDRGSAIKSGHLDVYVEDVNKAIQLGRKNLKVKILD